jgi:hypothetical protein
MLTFGAPGPKIQHASAGSARPGAAGGFLPSVML